MGQTKSKPFPSSLTSNSWRRLSDSDCIHLLSHPEYFDNQSINIDDKNGNVIRRSGSTSTFFDAVEPPLQQTSQDSLQSYNEINNQNHAVIRSISMSSSTTPMYRNSMYPGCVEHHQDNCVQNNRSNSIKRPFNQSGQRCSASPPPLPPPLTARIRPVSMFAYEDGNDDDALSAKPMVGSPAPAPPSTSLKQIENINISLNDLLERVNTTESVRLRRQLQESQDEDDSAQTLMSKHVDEIDETDEENKPSPPASSTDNAYKESPLHEAADLGNRSRHPVRCSGLDCMCDRCIQNRFKLLNWLLPNCTRMNSERLLSGKPDGTFLVRKSEKFPGQYTLSFVCRRTVRHCLIMRSVYGFGLRWPYSFETLQQVIVHYSRHSLTEFNSKLNIRLKYPVFSA